MIEDFVSEFSREAKSMSNLEGFHVILKWQLGDSMDEGRGMLRVLEPACMRARRECEDEDM